MKVPQIELGGLCKTFGESPINRNIAVERKVKNRVRIIFEERVIKNDYGFEEYPGIGIYW